MMSMAPLITSQDWYRIRRGEDQIAWGKARMAPTLPGVVFSLRSSQEFDYLDAKQQAAVMEALRALAAAPEEERGRLIEHGGGRRVLHLAPMRIVFRLDGGITYISTIRGGAVLDPENSGPPPGGEDPWQQLPGN